MHRFGNVDPECELVHACEFGGCRALLPTGQGLFEVGVLLFGANRFRGSSAPLVPYVVCLCSHCFAIASAFCVAIGCSCAYMQSHFCVLIANKLILDCSDNPCLMKEYIPLGYAAADRLFDTTVSGLGVGSQAGSGGSAPTQGPCAAARTEGACAAAASQSPSVAGGSNGQGAKQAEAGAGEAAPGSPSSTRKHEDRQQQNEELANKADARLQNFVASIPDLPIENARAMRGLARLMVVVGGARKATTAGCLEALDNEINTIKLQAEQMVKCLGTSTRDNLANLVAMVAEAVISLHTCAKDCLGLESVCGCVCV